MRVKIGILILIICAFIAYWVTSATGSITPHSISVETDILGRTASFANKQYLVKKLNEIDFWNKNHVSHLKIVLSNKPRTIVVAKRQSNDAGLGTFITSLAYNTSKEGMTATYYLYVNPSVLDTVLQHTNQAYTQLALVAFYQSLRPEGISEQDMRAYLSDYRSRRDINTIFNIK